MIKRRTILAVSILLLFAAASVSAQVLVEEFNYTPGDTLNGRNGWIVQPTPSFVNSIKAVSPGLTYSGYPAVLGNAVGIDTTGQDIYRPFTGQVSGDVYAAFLVNFSKVTATGDYFFHFTKAGTTTFLGRVFARLLDGNVSFGLMKGSTGTAVYTPGTYPLNTTHLVVLKNRFLTGGTTNDSVFLFVNPTFTGTEPAPTLSFSSTNTDFDTLSAVNLRQGTNTNAPRLTLDGIRVTTGWTELFAVNQVFSVGTGNVPGENGNFPSLKAAFDSLNNGHVFTGNATLFITSDITEPYTGNIGIGLAVDPSPFSLTIKPYTGVSPTITLLYPTDLNSGPSGAMIIGLTGASNNAWASNRPTRNIIFDGSNTPNGTTRDLTIQTTGATRNAFPMVIVADASNIVVKNCNLHYKVTPTASTAGNLFVSALMIRAATAANTGTTEKIPNNIIVENNHLSSNFAGAVQNAQGIGGFASAAPTVYPSGITIRRNLIEGKRRGISLHMIGSADIHHNEIILNQNVADGLANEAIYAVNSVATAVVNIHSNRFTRISSINSTGSATGTSAISIETAGTYNIFNNMITGFEAASVNANKSGYLYGIRIATATGTVNVSYNSIFMNDIASVGTGTFLYRGVFASNGTMNLRNNNIVSAENDFENHLLHRPNSGTAGVFAGTLLSNYNNLHPMGATNGRVGFYDAATTADLTSWMFASLLDQNSVSGDPRFVSATDLHANPTAFPAAVISNAGIPVVGITLDIDGDLRSATTPDIGADEYVANPTPPLVDFTVTPKTLTFGNVIVGANKMDSVVVSNASTMTSLVIDSVISTHPFFTVSPKTATLDTMASRKFFVTFSPASGGVVSATILFYHKGQAQIDTIRVSGKGLGWVTLAEARKDLNNDLIPDYFGKDTLLVYGVITSPNLSGSGTSYYIQDSTAGINVFSFNPHPTTFQRGDSVFVIGTIGQFRGLTEIFPISMTNTHFGVIASGKMLPAPKTLSVAQFKANAELYEGQLIRLDTMYRSSGMWAANGSVYLKRVLSSTDSVQMFIDTDTRLHERPEPGYPLNVTGLLIQYSSGSTILNDGYEIVPRDSADLQTIIISSVTDDRAVPIAFELMNNYPNPFNPTTTITFALPTATRVSLKVFDLLGREVRVLINKDIDAGYHRVVWDSRNGAGIMVPSGLYFYHIDAGNFKATKKMMLLK